MRTTIIRCRVALFLFTLLFASGLNAQTDRPEGCTTITVGKLASVDGSVITSHTLDDHRAWTTIDIQPQRTNVEGSVFPLFKVSEDNSGAMPAYRNIPTGVLPERPRTNGYINTALPCMNDKQLAIGESTFGGRESLVSNIGKIDLWRLVKILIERCSTAREAIRMAGQLTAQHGWRDVGECLTIADKAEVWHFEIVGPGRDRVGSIWAARRVPDGHVSVNANASRIRQLDLSNPDEFMASDNCAAVARDSGWWNPANGPFEFCYAYDPEGRESFASRRREWRVLDLLAPSLHLSPNAENYSFSVKPDSLVTVARLVAIFQDYYEGTDFDPIKNITWVNPQGKTEISPLASPFMPYDMLPLFKVNGGWGWRGERTIARWFTVYATITQSRGWLPDPVGGVVWLGWDNAATTLYTPIYCGVTDLPRSFKVDGRATGYSHDCAWWAFNQLSTLASQRWGDMHKDVDSLWKPLQRELFQNQSSVERSALEHLATSLEDCRTYLTEYSMKWGDRAVKEAWKLGATLWNKYDERF